MNLLLHVTNWLFGTGGARSKAVDANTYARMGARAFEEGRIAEATYWIVLADLYGFEHLEDVIAEYVSAWREEACLKQVDNYSETFGPVEWNFAHAAYLWISGKDRQRALAWFEAEEAAGNGDASRFLRRWGTIAEKRSPDRF